MAANHFSPGITSFKVPAPHAPATDAIRVNTES
jgi:hypothetical protein